MVVVVSRNTGRQDVIAAFITNAEGEPEAPDIVPTRGMDCENRVRGVVRCDQLYTLDVDDYAWDNRQVTHLGVADMAKIESGLRAALNLNPEL